MSPEKRQLSVSQLWLRTQQTEASRQVTREATSHGATNLGFRGSGKAGLDGGGSIVNDHRLAQKERSFAGCLAHAAAAFSLLNDGATWCDYAMLALLAARRCRHGRDDARCRHGGNEKRSAVSSGKQKRSSNPPRSSTADVGGVKKDPPSRFSHIFFSYLRILLLVLHSIMTMVMAAA